MQGRSDEFYDDFWGWCLKTFQPLIVTASIPAATTIYYKLGINLGISEFMSSNPPVDVTSIVQDDPPSTPPDQPDTGTATKVEPPKPAEPSAHNDPVVPPAVPTHPQDSLLEWFDSLLYVLIFLVAVVLLNLGGNKSEAPQPTAEPSDATGNVSRPESIVSSPERED